VIIMKHGTACRVTETAKRGFSSIALAFIVRGIPNPTITTAVATHTAANIDVAITTILGTAVA